MHHLFSEHGIDVTVLSITQFTVVYDALPASVFQEVSLLGEKHGLRGAEWLAIFFLFYAEIVSIVITDQSLHYLVNFLKLFLLPNDLRFTNLRQKAISLLESVD